MLPLRVVVIPARDTRLQPPVFVLSGGPGQAATASAPFFAGGWERQDRDVVLMDVRGTGAGHALNCSLGGSDDNLQAYLEPLFFDGSRYSECREELEREFDLNQYTTPIAMQDLDELRQAMGLDKVILAAGSYGTRAALTYVRMFGDRVHSALLNSLVPIENRAPLYHAAAAQRAFDELVRQCQNEAPCHSAYPSIRSDLETVLQRLRKAPAQVRLLHPVTRAPAEVTLSEPAFADAIRVMLYSAEGGRRLPLLLKRARDGDLGPFAEAAMRSSRGLKLSLRQGLLLAFTCGEDVWRIRPDEVARETRGSFIGDWRVRGQMAACAGWPRGHVPEDYYRPFKSNVPVLLVSGNLDPVTPPQWGELLRKWFPNSVHVVLPGGHVPTNACVQGLAATLFRTGRVAGLETSCVQEVRNPPFQLPETSNNSQITPVKEQRSDTSKS